MRRFIIVFALVLLAGCTKKEKGITIEFWTLQLSPVFDSYFNSLVKEYEASHPGIRIKYVDIPYDAATQKLLSSVASGQSPDVVNLSCDFLSKFAEMKALTDISEYRDRKELENLYFANALDECSVNKKIIALPWYLNSYAVIYNKTLLSNAGFSEKDVPRTYDQLLNFIKEYKDRTGKFAFFWSIGKESYLPMALASDSMELCDASISRALFNTPDAVKKISEWVDLYKGGYLDKDCIMKTNAGVIEAYQSGQCAMVFTGTNFLRRIKDNAPGIYKNTGIAPALTGKSGRHELAAMCLTVLKTSEHKKEAVDFAMYVTNAKNQLAFCKLVTIYPSVLEAMKDSYFTTEDGTLETKARIIGTRQLASAVRLRLFLLHPRCDLLQQSFDEAIQDACTGKKATRQAVADAAKEWNQILSSYEK